MAPSLPPSGRRAQPHLVAKPSLPPPLWPASLPPPRPDSLSLPRPTSLPGVPSIPPSAATPHRLHQPPPPTLTAPLPGSPHRLHRPLQHATDLSIPGDGRKKDRFMVNPGKNIRVRSASGGLIKTATTL
nr:proline-rich receptor-like protein kinase PERK2 [Aegilops tauschii subsp. strangulata]